MNGCCLKERHLRSNLAMAHNDLNDRAKKLARNADRMSAEKRAVMVAQVEDAKARIAELKARLAEHVCETAAVAS